MPLSVLTDEQIKGLLESMTADEAESFYMNLRDALHDYSVGTASGEDADIHQPHRVSFNSSSTGATTLFMPCGSLAGIGIKVVTLTPPSKEGSSDQNKKSKIKPTGAITLLAPTGEPVGLLHASTLTAFRTALASTCLVVRRNKVQTLTVFGSGEQAYWHVRLALMLRGSTIRNVNVINHQFSDSCRQLLKRFHTVPAEQKAREGWTEANFGVLTPGYGEFKRLLKEQVRAADVIFCCTPSMAPLFDHTILTSSEGRKKGRLIVAIGSYRPEMLEIPLEVVHQAVKRHEAGHRHFHRHAVEGGVVVVDTLDGALIEAGEIIQGGLTPNQLVELGELVMLNRVRMDEESASSDAGSIVSDNSIPQDLEKLDLNSSKSISSPRTSDELKPTVHRPGLHSRSSSSTSISQFFRRPKSSQGSGQGDEKKKKEGEDHLCRWLQGGNVIYKSVGLGLMDLTVGMKVIEFAREKGVGTHVEGF